MLPVKDCITEATEITPGCTALQCDGLRKLLTSTEQLAAWKTFKHHEIAQEKVLWSYSVAML